MNTKLLERAAMALTTAALVSFTSCSSTPGDSAMPNPPPPPPPPPAAAGPQFLGTGVSAGVASGLVRVISVDLAQRTVLLRRADGTTATFQAGPEAVNLDKIRAGDNVMTSVTESYTAFLTTGGVSPSSITNVVVAGKPKGSQPGGVMIRTVDYNAKVLDVNYANRNVILQYGANQAKKVQAGPNINLAALNAGDDVLIRVTEAMAIAVVRP